METILVKLTEQEVAAAKKQADKYYALIQKELSMGDLVNLENVKRYTLEYKTQMCIVQNPYIEMPKI
jgi:hypothetical protein